MADQIEKAKVAIGEDSPDDYKITPTSFPASLEQSAPELSEILRHSSFQEIAKRYERHDSLAISSQTKFKKYAHQTTWAICIAAISKKVIVASLLIILVTGCAKNIIQEGSVDARKVPLIEIEKVALYAMMSSNAYLDKERTYFPIEKLGWVRVDLDGNPTEKNSYTPTSFLGKLFSNLQFDIWEHQDSNQTVISFKGTDEKIDWLTNFWIGPSVQYKSAKKHVKKYIDKNTGRNVVVTGHSLGGGLALSSSLWLGVDAYAYNSSPRVFDGWKDNKMPAVRKVVYQENEVLSKVRSFWPKFIEVLNEKDIYQTNFDFNGVSKHRADYLAEGLLRCVPNNTKLGEFATELLPIKVICNQ